MELTLHLELFVTRRTCWKLTWTSRVLLLVAVIGLIMTAGRGLCGFLSVTSPVQGRFLVVESWMPAYALREAVAVFGQAPYEKIIAAGLDGGDDSVTDQCVSDKSLVRFGAPIDRVVTANAATVSRDRTFHAALAVKNWLQQQGAQFASVDIITLGPHSRRSRLLFEQALGAEVRVGVIAVSDRRFEAAYWWRSSAGFRIVIGEAIAYLYARCFPWAHD